MSRDLKCETARHDELQAGCLKVKHQKCEVCGRCYTCDAQNKPVTRIPRVER